MYKVFVNKKPIILSDKAANDSTCEIYLYKEISFEEVLHKLRHTQTPGIYLYHPNLALLWKDFKASFTTVVAAGGLVLKDQLEILLIFRNQNWDLPKGKMEEGESKEETALREVEEECGTAKLSIEKPLHTTYHIFYEDNENKLKVTHWFLMKTDDDKEPIPQHEEGISLAKFVPTSSIETLYKSMYPNIQELIKNYLDNKI